MPTRQAGRGAARSSPKPATRRGHRLAIELDASSTSVVALAKQVQAGLPFELLTRFQRSSRLPITQIAQLVRIPPRTLSRRKTEGRLRPDESDRLLRACNLFKKAVDLFDGDAQAATQWLASPQKALGGHVPFDLAQTEIGARGVEDLIGQLEHGIVV